MATYIFKCTKCRKQEEKEIPINEYDKEKHKQVCKCGASMQRVFTDIGMTVYNCKGMYDTDQRKTNCR